jgi:hypothetical protein
VKGVGGYAKLKFALGKHETWANVGWALDELNIDVEDKDINCWSLNSSTNISWRIILSRMACVNATCYY